MAARSMISSHLFLLVVNSFLGAASAEANSLHSALARVSDDLYEDVVFRHMSRLYDKYNKDNCLKEGNTVRSFRASQDVADHRMIYQLNLTTLQDTEVILSATLHFLLERNQKPWFCKRFKSPSCRSSPLHHTPSISLLLHSVSSGSGARSESLRSFLGKVTFHLHRRGVWQMKDVTRAIREARDKGHQLVSVEVELGKQHQRKPVEMLSASSVPYLLLYANDQALAEPNSVAASLQRYDPFNEGTEPLHSSQALHSPELKGRVRREANLLFDPIQNNELPDVNYMHDEYRKKDLWESTWYLALKHKTKTGRKEKKRKSPEEEGGEQVEGAHELDGERTSQGTKTADSAVGKLKDSQTVTIGDRRKHDSRNEGKDRKKQKGSTNTLSPVLRFDEQTMRKARRRQWSHTQHRGCTRRNLRVDFADIGWSEWVIAPKAFDAYYCAGTCGFPIPKVTRPTNHATLQSIVRAVGIIPGVPEPCCVPENMSPLAVLFQDESRNPVLKVYPNMSVQSCSCR
ncbi:growth/differentiation factor 10 [Pholidichthys leucotaenia]